MWEKNFILVLIKQLGVAVKQMFREMFDIQREFSVLGRCVQETEVETDLSSKSSHKVFPQDHTVAKSFFS